MYLPFNDGYKYPYDIIYSDIFKTQKDIWSLTNKIKDSVTWFNFQSSKLNYFSIFFVNF